VRKIQNITEHSFKKYGTRIDFTAKDGGSDFEIIISHETDPWRIAVLRVKDKAFTGLEKHPHSLETFEPLEGMCVLLLSDSTDKKDYEAFLLDQSVCLHKDIWHGIVTLTPESKVKITENLTVETEYYKFDQPKEIVVD